MVQHSLAKSINTIGAGIVTITFSGTTNTLKIRENNGSDTPNKGGMILTQGNGTTNILFTNGTNNTLKVFHKAQNLAAKNPASNGDDANKVVAGNEKANDNGGTIFTNEGNKE